MGILITGGGGFVGLALAECLLGQGEDVLLFDRAAPSAVLLEALRRRTGRVPSVRVGDIRSAADVTAALLHPGIDRIVHAAAITPDAAREAREPMRVTDVNVGGTAHLLQACEAVRRAQGTTPRRVLVLSSVAVYGVTPPPGPRYEEATAFPAPVALYGITKLAAETTALRLSALYGIDVRVARLGPVYGPWEYATGVRDALSPHTQVLLAGLAGRDVLLPRAMGADWLSSRDAARALAALVSGQGLRHPVYNVGGGVVSDVPQWCEQLAPALRLRHPDWSWRIARPGEAPSVRYGLPVDRAALDTRRLQADTGWTPQDSLATVAAHQLEWQDEILQAQGAPHGQA